MADRPKNFEIVERQAVFQGYFRVDRYRVRYERYDGGWSNALVREVFERGHAAALLPYDPVRDEVILIEQFRIGAHEAPGGAWVLEPVAGIIEPGESAEDVARREAREEAGVAIGDLIHIADCLASPGGSSERVSHYCGRVDTSGAGGVFGLDHEGEDIKALVLPFEDALAEVLRRETVVSNMLIPLYWLALNKARVRAMWTA